MRRPLLSAIALGLVAGSAQAQAVGEEAMRFDFVAPSACPDVTAFAARVRERTARGRPAEPAELARTFTLRITAQPTGFTGTVEFLDDTGGNVSRRVHGEECDGVVSSLALITALALDASLRPSEEPAPVSAPESPAAPPPTKPPAIAAKPTRWVSDEHRGPSARIGVRGGYRVPLDAYSLALLGQLDWSGGLAVRLTAHYASADHEVDAERRANLRLMGVAASVCALTLSRDAFAFALCPELDVGSLRAQALPSPGLTRLGSGTMAWLALGAELRLAWEPAAPFWLELNGQIQAPLVTHSFVFDRPSATVFEVKPLTSVSVGVGVATGVRFW